MAATQIAPSAPASLPCPPGLIEAAVSPRPLSEAHLTLGAVSNQQFDFSRHHFQRWRPKFHVMAPRGWMNDPCAPGYNPVTKTYHLGFQWNPKGCTWGNMSWGSALSEDLVTWFVSPMPSIEPSEEHDPGGVFTGCLRGTNLFSEVDGSLTIFYTSAQQLPINFALQYTPGCEKIHAATSVDNGKTWLRHPGNPIVSKPLDRWSVTGWRDPFVSSWESMDRLFDSTDEHLYAITSGGICGKTPTAFLYQIHGKMLDDWRPIGPMIDIGLNFRPSRWSGDFGVSWEVANFMSLCDETGEWHDFLVTGVEGRTKSSHTRSKSDLIATHGQMWLCGKLAKTKDGVEMTFRYGAALDYGAYYAANTFWDPNSQQRIAFGWVFEEDLPPGLVERQGWSGCLSIPRIIRLTTIKSVVRALKSPLQALTCMDVVPEQDGTHTLRTLTATPDPRLRRLRRRKLPSTSIQTMDKREYVVFPASLGAQWELEASFELGNTSKSIGFEVSHSADFRFSTEVCFDSDQEMVIIDRSRSTSAPGVNVSREEAPHTLFTTRDSDGTLKQEAIIFHAFYDGSVMELFVNGRTAITTRIYPESGTCFAIRSVMDSCIIGVESSDQTQKLQFDVWTLQKSVA